MESTARMCGRCGGEKHYTGTRWRCSPCYNAWQTKRRTTLTPEQKAADNATRTATRRAWSDERRAKVNAAIRAWREGHREQHRQGSRDWYWRDVEARRAAKLAEYRRNREAFYARNLVRKARLKDAVCEHGPDCVSGAFLQAVYGEPCFYCDKPAEHADHFYPIARGGLHCVDNLVPACASCNSSKNASDPWEWIEARLVS